MDDDSELAVYDTCDTVRRKIRAILAKHGITQASFLRAIAKAAYGVDTARKIQHASLGVFLRQEGPLSGNTGTVYYAAYVFFEMLRVKHDKPKTADRGRMEELHKNGVDRKTPPGKAHCWVYAGMEVGMDKYGQLHSYMA